MAVEARRTIDRLRLERAPDDEGLAAAVVRPVKIRYVKPPRKPR